MSSTVLLNEQQTNLSLDDLVDVGLGVKQFNALPTDPIEYAAQCLRIMDKDDHIVPFVWNEVQRDYHINRTSRDIILKPRQIGFSTYIRGEFYRIATSETARTLTLTDTDDNTAKFRRMDDRFHEYMPDSLRPKRKYANASVTTYAHNGSEAMIATAGNTTVGRAGSYRFIHLSEAAFYPDLQSILASALQGGRPQWVAIESTPNGAQGKFYEMCMEALDGNSVWRLHFYPWFGFADYRLPLLPDESLVYSSDELALIDKFHLSDEQLKWRRFKIGEIGSPTLFNQEYPSDPVTCFLTSGNGVFGDFTHALYTPVGIAYIDGHIYLAALDFGQENDYTALSIVDITDNREVYLNRWRQMPWADIRRSVLDACEYWHVCELYPERNSASSNIENLQSDIDVRGLQIDLVPYAMTNDRKSQMVGQLYTAIHEGEYKLLDIDWANAELRNFVSKQTPLGAWTYGGANDSHDDTVVARMAAKWGAARRI